MSDNYIWQQSRQIIVDGNTRVRLLYIATVTHQIIFKSELFWNQQELICKKIFLSMFTNISFSLLKIFRWQDPRSKAVMKIVKQILNPSSSLKPNIWLFGLRICISAVMPKWLWGLANPALLRYLLLTNWGERDGNWLWSNSHKII